MILSTVYSTTESCTNAVAMVGGGSNPMPGEISLAHHGVLFLDENLEFVSIPGTVWRISDFVFVDCAKLANVYDLSTEPQEIYGKDIFRRAGPDNVVNVHVYEGLYDVYTSTLGWYDIPNEYFSHINIIADIPVVPIESIEFVNDVIYCGVGEQKKAEIKIFPENALVRNLRWSTDNESILYVDMFTGDFIGLQEGEAILTVTAGEEKSFTASAKIIVGNDAGIEILGLNEEKIISIYDLYGRPLKGVQKGINIINGKKVLIK